MYIKRLYMIRGVRCVCVCMINTLQIINHKELRKTNMNFSYTMRGTLVDYTVLLYFIRVSYSNRQAIICCESVWCAPNKECVYSSSGVWESRSISPLIVVCPPPNPKPHSLEYDTQFCRTSYIQFWGNFIFFVSHTFYFCHEKLYSRHSRHQHKVCT